MVQKEFLSITQRINFHSLQHATVSLEGSLIVSQKVNILIQYELPVTLLDIHSFKGAENMSTQTLQTNVCSNTIHNYQTLGVTMTSFNR